MVVGVGEFARKLGPSVREVEKPKSNMAFSTVHIDSMVKGGCIMQGTSSRKIKQTKISPPIIIKERQQMHNSPKAVTVGLSSSFSNA